MDREALNKRLLEERERLDRELAGLDADMAETATVLCVDCKRRDEHNR